MSDHFEYFVSIRNDDSLNYLQQRKTLQTNELQTFIFAKFIWPSVGGLEKLDPCIDK